MGRKRYRIRRSGCIPIRQVRIRESHVHSMSAHRHNRRWYPLFESWQSIYNYRNLLESIYSWDSYSEDDLVNLMKVATVLKEISDHGTTDELDEATNYICDHILINVPDTMLALDAFDTVGLTNESMNTIAQACDLYRECDRVSSNFALLDSKYDITRMLMETCRDWPIKESVYRLCEMTDTFAFTDFQTKFPVLIENTLYAFSNIIQEFEIPSITVTNSVIDYYLVTEGCQDFDKFYNDILQSSKSSYFINYNLVEHYMNFLKKVNDGDHDVDSRATQAYIESVMDTYNYIGEAKRLLEETLYDTAKEWMAKIKLAPIKTVYMLREAIRAIFVTSRLQDIKKSTHNSLSLAFYGLVTLGLMKIGAPAVALGAITSYLLSKAINKQYLQDALQEWKDHRYSIKRRLKSTTDSEQKSRLEDYLAEVDKNIEVLEKEYKNTRDKTNSELNSDVVSSQKDYKPGYWQTQVAPDGNYTSYSQFAKDPMKNRGVNDNE